MAGPTNDLRYKLVLQDGRNFSITLGGAQGPAGPPGQNGSQAFVGATPPEDPNDGDFWFDTEELTTKIRYGGEWIVVSGTGTVVSDVEPTDPKTGTLWYSKTTGLAKLWDGTTWVSLMDLVVFGSPILTNTAWGGIPAGTQLQGYKLSEIITKATVVYQQPSFTSFSIDGEGTIMEIGDSIASPATFRWDTVNDENFADSSIEIRNANNGVVLATGLQNDKIEEVELDTDAQAPVTYNTSKYFRIRAAKKAPETGIFERSLVIQGRYPWFWGVSETQPDENGLSLAGGTKVLGATAGNLYVPFDSEANQYLWVALPTVGGVADATKTKWYVDELNKGNIGIGPSTDLFKRSTAVKSKAAPSGSLWGSTFFYIYISNYPTAIGTVQLRP